MDKLRNILLLFPLLSAVAQADHGEPADRSDAILLSGLGDHVMPVSTTSETAQAFFNQGIRLCYAFNHEEAIRAFKAAAAADPSCAMAWWGVAFALGPNINAPMGPEAAVLAFEAAQKAAALADKVSPRERDYIAAIAKRYAADPPTDRAELDEAFAKGMREVYIAYPDDLDAATLYAEALMDRTPWSYWNEDGTAKSPTREILEALQTVLRRNPDHPGANHLYIHAVEASPSPERGLASAFRVGELMPAAGHLVHMPSHIYLRLGMYDDAVECNKEAVQADKDYIDLLRTNWISVPALYPAMYYSHNVHFLWYAQTMLGQSADASIQARSTANVIEEFAKHDMPMLEWMKAVPLADMVRFGRWDQIQIEPEPRPEKRIEFGIWLFARGMADIRQGEFDRAESSSQALTKLAESPEIAILETPQFPSQQVLRIAAKTLSAELAGAKGDKAAHIASLEEAVALEDKLPYMEPPYWYFPIRHYLGAALLEAKEPALAEDVYREDLRRNPQNGWALFGLLQSLRQQGKNFAAKVVQREFRDAWQHSDFTLTSSRF